MSSPESFTPEGAENIVTSDESPRITSPEKAEYMARESNGFRAQAVDLRQQAKDLKEVGALGSQYADRDAKLVDDGAEKVEKFSQMEFEITNEVASIPTSEYPSRLQATEQKIQSVKERMKVLENAVEADPQKRSSLIQEIKQQENRLNLYKREYEKGIE